MRLNVNLTWAKKGLSFSPKFTKLKKKDSLCLGSPTDIFKLMITKTILTYSPMKSVLY